jgi:hypothetical protein
MNNIRLASCGERAVMKMAMVPSKSKQTSACSLDGTKVAVADCFAELAA